MKNIKKEAKDLLIPVGEAVQCFNRFNELKGDLHKVQIKCTVVQIATDPVKLLLHLPIGGNRLDVSGAIFFMQKNNIKSIRTNGSTNLIVDVKNKTITVQGESNSLGKVCKEEIFSLLLRTFYNFEFTFKIINGQGFKRSHMTIDLDGEDYTVEDLIATIQPTKTTN